MDVRTSFLKPTQIIYLVFENNDLFIYLIEQKVFIFIYCFLIFIPFLLSVNNVHKYTQKKKFSQYLCFLIKSTILHISSSFFLHELYYRNFTFTYSLRDK